MPLNIDKGLAGTVAADTALSFIDGAKGVLEYAGYDIDSLARSSNFEETSWLLWNGRLPTSRELAEFGSALQAEYALDPRLIDLIRTIPRTAAPMDALRTSVSAMGHFDPEADDNSVEANRRKALRLVAKTPGLIATFDRWRKGKPLAAPDSSLSIAGNFLWMLTGARPTPAMERALDVCLVLHADHGLNASTFAARVTISTQSDMYSAATTAVGTLKGPLHGGANQEVMEMLLEIGELEKVDGYINGKLARKERIMGFGHRVYKAYDPRATYLKTFARQVASDTGNLPLFEMSRRIEEIVLAQPNIIEKGIFPNVDFYSATTYYSLGLDLDLFTCMFAASRMSGWTGHCIEQLAANKLIRPHADYTGPRGLAYVAIGLREDAATSRTSPSARQTMSVAAGAKSSSM
ncbi:MAG: citrate synthase [Phycisphaerales bacterium]|nr:citrate synthase [Phycisphaerales bacterium]